MRLNGLLKFIWWSTVSTGIGFLIVYCFRDKEENVSVQRERLKHLNDVCRRLNASQRHCTPYDSYIYVGDNHRFIYCLVSKASCTSWKRTLVVLTGNLDKKPHELLFHYVHNNKNSDLFVKRFPHYSPEEIEWRLNNYFKFMFVRDPLERLVSVYRDKMFRDKQYMKIFVPKILKQYRWKDSRNITFDPTNSTDRVTFAEFVRFVLDSWRSNETLDRHWQAQHQLCCPCHIHYDFIGRQETLYHDADQVLTYISKPGHDKTTVEFPRSDPDNTNKTTSGLLQEMFSTVPIEDIRSLFDMYSLDYELFNFTRPQITGTV